MNNFDWRNWLARNSTMCRFPISLHYKFAFWSLVECVGHGFHNWYRIRERQVIVLWEENYFLWKILVGFTFKQKEKSTSSFYSDFHALPVRSQCCGLVESEARQHVWSYCCCSWGRSVLPVVSTFSLKAAWIIMVYCHSGVLWKL